MSKTYCGVRDCGLTVDDPKSDVRVLQCERCKELDAHKDAPEPTPFEVIDVRGIPFILYGERLLVNISSANISMTNRDIVVSSMMNAAEVTLMFNDEAEAKSAFDKLTGKTDQPPLLNQLKANKAKNHANEQAQAQNI